MDKGDDPYQILGLSKSGDTTTITTSAIKKAYRELARIYHPDKNNNADASTLFAKISHAYDILKDDESRQSYDLSQKHQQGYDPNGPTYSSSSPRATPTSTTTRPSTNTTRTTTTHHRTPMTTTTYRTKPTTKTYSPNNNTNYNSTGTYNGGEVDDNIQSMSSKERTVTNPITKCKEVITEITVTKFDGSVEVRTEKRQQHTNNNKKDDNNMKIRTPRSKNKEASTMEIKKNKDKKKKKKKAAQKENDQQQQQYIPMGQNKTTSVMNSPTGSATDLYNTMPSSTTSSKTNKTSKKKKKVLPSTTKEMMIPSFNSTNISANSTTPKMKKTNTPTLRHRTTTTNKSHRKKSSIDDDVQSMSTKERTVLNPLTKRKELIIETTVTKFDGSCEVRTERKQV